MGGQNIEPTFLVADRVTATASVCLVQTPTAMEGNKNSKEKTKQSQECLDRLSINAHARYLYIAKLFCTSPSHLALSLDVLIICMQNDFMWTRTGFFKNNN